MNRAQMLRDCPEDFKEELTAIIDHIEGEVNVIVNLLEIGSIDEIGSPPSEAKEKADELASALY